MHDPSVSLWDLRTIPLRPKWTKDLTLYCLNKIKEIMILILQNFRKPIRQTIFLIGIIWWAQFQSYMFNTWIYVYIKNFNSNSNSREFQLQFQLQLREFQLQLQLRQVSWISTPTPTPGVSTPTPTPANLQNINSNSNSNSGGFNSNSGVGVEPNSNSNSGVDPNPGGSQRICHLVQETVGESWPPRRMGRVDGCRSPVYHVPTEWRTDRLPCDKHWNHFNVTVKTMLYHWFKEKILCQNLAFKLIWNWLFQ